MSRAMKIWLIIAASLVSLGCFVFAGVMTMLNWDFMKLSTNRYETNEHQIGDEFKNIVIRSDTARIELVGSESDEGSAVCYEHENAKHSVYVKDGTLFIELVNERKWYEYIGINTDVPKITLCIPQGEYGDLDINVSTGDVDIPEKFGFENIDVTTDTGRVRCQATAKQDVNITATTGSIFASGVSAASLRFTATTGKIDLNGINAEGDLSVSVSTGKARVEGVTCKNFRSNGDTGKLYLGYLKAEEKITVKRSTGDVTFEACDAAEISVRTETGDVEGSLLSEKVFITRTDTGNVDVPRTTSGGRCEIITDTGDIKITVH